MSDIAGNTNAAFGWVRTPRIFVVDDERLIAGTLAEILRLNGYDAVPMYTSTAALDRLAEDDCPDLLITDVALDQDSINGIDLAIYYERDCPRCRVLLISGHANTAALHARARDTGHAFPLLQKPIRPESLLETVSGLLAGLQDRGELRRAS
jgi:DNA-binding NtrC family response regulator